MLFYSCNNDERIESIVPDLKIENFVSLDEVSNIASSIEYPIACNDTHTKSKNNANDIKEIEKIIAIPDNQGKPCLYIINYVSDGFVIISADKRTSPIRAFSLSEKFPLNSEKLPSGLVGWLAESSDMISEIRILNENQSESVSKTWRTSDMQKIIGRNLYVDPTDDPDPDPDPDFNYGEEGKCDNEFKTIGPLLKTSWGQGFGYNNLVPSTGCSKTINHRAYTGCVATAMAQIMKYHKFPNNYNWKDMPNDKGSNETSRLMKDIGLAVNMNYGCDGSSADTESEVASSFINDFGYSSAVYSSYNTDILKRELSHGRPVLLRGGRKSGWWKFVSYKDGHAWVCDGYRRSFYCETGTAYLFFHMNWGWTQYSRLNGWFAYNRWNPDVHSFDYKRGMVYNIDS